MQFMAVYSQQNGFYLGTHDENCNFKDFEYYFTQKLDVAMHGTGDIYASVVVGALCRGKSLLEAASLAADFVVESIKNTLGDDDHWYGAKFEKAIPYLVSRLEK